MIPSQLIKSYAFYPRFWFPARISRIIWMEMLVSSLLIGLLIFIAAHIFTGYTQTAKVAQAVLGVMAEDIKTGMMVHHAQTGEWPQSVVEIDQWRTPDDNRKPNEPNHDQLRIDHGALHIALTSSFQGHTVTLRPAVPAEDLFGPVAWICGPPLNPDRWYIEGEDQTDIPRWAIHPKLR